MRMATQAKTAQEITAWCRDYISNALGVPADSIDPDQEFDALGLDSAVITSMLIELEEWIGLDIPPSTFFAQSTLSAMGSALAERAASESAGA
jgi:acyl carrier protein